jgi:hypothetical protein
MRTVRTKVYQFSELDEQTQQKAINSLSDINVNYEWWEFIYEDAANIGLEITSFDLDRRRGADGNFTLSACEVAANILSEHGESCETYKTAENFMSEWQPIFNEYMDENSANYESSDSEQKLLELENEFLSNLLEDYSIILQKQSEYLQSSEAIIETIEANEYEFTKEGNRF